MQGQSRYCFGFHVMPVLYVVKCRRLSTFRYGVGREPV